MKSEKIGNVILDYTYYPGEDQYSDGTVEDEMLEMAKSCPPESMTERSAAGEAGRCCIIFPMSGKIL